MGPDPAASGVLISHVVVVTPVKAHLNIYFRPFKKGPNFTPLNRGVVSDQHVWNRNPLALAIGYQQEQVRALKMCTPKGHSSNGRFFPLLVVTSTVVCCGNSNNLQICPRTNVFGNYPPHSHDMVPKWIYFIYWWLQGLAFIQGKISNPEDVFPSEHAIFHCYVSLLERLLVGLSFFVQIY